MKRYFPPKPLLITIDQPLFSELEMRKDVVAEPKYNGDRLVLMRFSYTGLFPTAVRNQYEFWNRYGEQLRKYSPSNELIKQLNGVAWNGECTLDGELLHFKTKKVKNCIILFDDFIWNGEPKLNSSFDERRSLLESKVAIPEDCIANPLNGLFKNDTVRLAPQVRGGRKDCFRNFYEMLIKHDEIEGIVIKSLKARVILGRTESPVVPYMWKVRKPGPTYRF